MANVQTDQGWYADEYWVRQSAGVLGSVAGGGGQDDPLEINVIPTFTYDSLVANGTLFYQYSYWGIIDNYLGSSGGRVFLGWWLNGSRYWNYVVATTASGVAVCEGSTRWSGTTDTWYLDTYDETTGLYYYTRQIGEGITRYGPNCGTSVADCLTAIKAFIDSGYGDTLYSKIYSGYAVACWAKYKGYGGNTEYVRSILISASQDAAHIKKGDQSGSEVEYVYTKDSSGHDLYMSMSIDAIDPEELTPSGAWLADFTSATMPSVTPSDIADTLFPLILGASNFHWGEIDNPYAGGGTSGPGGGDGTFDFESTPVAFPGLPSIGGYDTGFTTMYNPTTSELKALANYMWAGAFDVDNFKKLFADPMDAIIGLSLVPLTQAQIAGATSTLVVGNISTGLSMKQVSVQYVQVNCGTVQVPAKWGAYLDYAPYTKLQLYLPYIGFVDIAPDDVMNGSISVQYTIDLMSGTALASVMCKDHVLYCFGANCSCSCPVTSGQYKNGALGVLDGIGIAASTAAQMIPSIKDMKAGGIGVNSFATFANTVATGAEGLHKEFNNVQSMYKPAISRSGSIGGPMGLMNIQIPYLVLTIPRMCTPGNQETYMGYPSFVTKQMTDLSGYTEIMVTHLNNMSCTSVEAEEIISLLENGVIF